jgi:hypothetical protein
MQRSCKFNLQFWFHRLTKISSLRLEIPSKTDAYLFYSVIHSVYSGLCEVHTVLLWCSRDAYAYPSHRSEESVAGSSISQGCQVILAASLLQQASGTARIVWHPCDIEIPAAGCGGPAWNPTPVWYKLVRFVNEENLWFSTHIPAKRSVLRIRSAREFAKICDFACLLMRILWLE